MKNTPITENHLFAKAYSKGKNANGKYVSVYVLKDYANRRFRNADPMKRPLNRLGLTVGKKTGIAVERVRARRLMRESYRLIEQDETLSLEHGYLIVLAARKRIIGAKMQDVKEDIEKSMSKLGILKKTQTDAAAVTEE